MIAVRLEIGADPDTRVTTETGSLEKRTSTPLQADEALR
jgi:hypothetical protein